MEYGGPHGGPNCYSGPPLPGGLVLIQDRRTLNVAVVDCTDPTTDYYPIRGRTTGIEPDGFIQYFLLTPWQVSGGGVHEIYAEIVGPVGGAIDPDLVKRWVQLYE